MKNNKGITLIKLMLIVVFIGLITFAGYEIIYLDALGLLGADSSSVDTANNPIRIFGQDSTETKTETKEAGSLESIAPALDEKTIKEGVSEDTSKINHYYYRQLDDNAKIIYRGMEENIGNMQSGTYKVDFGKQFNKLLKSDGGDEKLKIAFQSAWNAFSYDYPDMFYIDVSKLTLVTKNTRIATLSTFEVELSNGSNSTYLSTEIKSSKDLKKKLQYIKTVREAIVKQLKGYSKHDQVKYLHDWLIDNMEYDTTYKKPDIHNIYGALGNKEVVCEGYARTFKYILDGLGIDCVLVSGEATNSTGTTELHAWNYVKLNGKWYAVDVTWDDPMVPEGARLSESDKHKFFLKGSNSFLKNHKENGYISENSIKFKFPKLEKENY